MGANAQTSVPVFTAGQVLTAQQQTEINTGIPVFATTTTRDAAFGGTGEKVLAEGQFAYIEDTNVTQYYDGANWIAIGAGFTTLKAETSFTTATSVTADNVFTSDYTFYRIMMRYLTSTTQNAAFRLRVGGVSAATNYNFQEVSGVSTTVAASRSISQTSISLIRTTGLESMVIIDLVGPALAQPTIISMFDAHTNSIYTAPELYLRSANHSTATAYDGFEFFVATGTTSGFYSVYGYGKNV